MRYFTCLLFVLGLAAVASAQAPTPRKPVYDESANAKADIAKAIGDSQRDHKRLLLVFGGNW